MPSKSLSSMNCFFYARNPSAYLAIYPNISPYDYEVARAARDAVIRWASCRIPGASQWNDGWSLLPDSLSIRPTKRPRHNPNFTIKSITITSANIIVYVTTDVDIFKIRIKESGITNPDVTTPLLHKMMSTDAHFTPPSGPWTRLPHHSQHQEPIINSVNIPDTYIHSIMTQQYHLFAPTEVTSAPSPPLRTTSETTKESAYKQLKTTVSATSSTTTVLTATSTPLKDQTIPTKPNHQQPSSGHQYLHNAHLRQHHSDHQHLYLWTTRHTHHPHTTQATAPQNHHITILYHLTRELSLYSTQYLAT
ncbi:hypothetical protein DPMN_121457 [Dreissena polymorpha]|uniref:Uncharacterized protein n=1 Tax=Dreissena polymorpha TaxID=45954 RepID=A0A9D4GM45_DREPO|nr:hypothetical protein DPMN_121457 [Dreissena polymorpha]